MSLPTEPKGSFLSDLAGIEDQIARSTGADAAPGEPSDPREKRYRHLVENSLGLICTHDLNGVLLSVNPAVADSLGYDRGDGVGRNLRDFLSPSTRHLFDDYLRRIGERSRDSGLMRVLRKDGSERLWLYRNVLYSEPGERPYVLGHAIDITERATAEAALRRNQTQTLEATGRLAGHVAQAFNNLLTLILGSAEMLQAEIPAGAPAQSHLETILKAASRGAAVTRQLLAVGEQQLIETRRLDLNAVISGLQSLIARAAGPRSVLQLALDPDLPAIEADTTQIEQMLLHLASNAREAMEPNGGTLTIETSVVRHPGHPGTSGVGASDDVRLTVRDTGCGMDAGTKAHLFEPFFTTRPTNPESGLGLSAAQGIVRQHGGSIAVESEPGKGTSFTIVLPQASAERVTAPLRDVGISAHTPNASTVVVVDDQEDVRSLMVLMLRRRGYSVLDAPSGADAIRLVESSHRPVDLLITDVMMSGIGGRELYEYLSSRHPHMKVLFVSGYADEAVRGSFAGVPFLSKPFMLDTLARKVRDVLGASAVTDRKKP